MDERHVEEARRRLELASIKRRLASVRTEIRRIEDAGGAEAVADLAALLAAEDALEARGRDLVKQGVDPKDPRTWGSTRMLPDGSS